jgi:hypothetical protein
MQKTLRDLINVGDPAAEALLTAEPKLVCGPVRVLSWGRAIELVLGNKRLRLYRDIPVNPRTDLVTKDWILVEPDCFTSGIAGFARLKSGQTLMVGRGNDSLDKIFGFPKSVKRRHLDLVNDNGEIIIKPLASDEKSYLCSVPENENVDWLSARRVKNLKRLRTIFGGPIELLEPGQAMAILEQIHAILIDEAYRPKDSENRPGGLLDLPGEPTPIIIGDLHAQLDNLLKILSQDGYLDALERGDAYLLFLGDIVHREGDSELEEMDSSLLILDLVFKLKIHFPKNLFYLRGNHEIFDDEVGKGGVPQARLLWQRCRELRGKKYAERLAECFDLLAYLAKSKDFIACHAGPPRREVSLQKLIDIKRHPMLERDLVWNRLRRTGHPGGYGKRDVKALRKALSAKKDTPFIVSHSPLMQTGAIWTDVGGVPGHHIMFSANPNKLAVFVRSRNEMIPLEYPGEPLLSFVNGFEDD